MKKIILLLIICFFSGLRLLANDGVFYAEGNTLIPLQETQVELKKEDFHEIFLPVKYFFSLEFSI